MWKIICTQANAKYLQAGAQQRVFHKGRYVYLFEIRWIIQAELVSNRVWQNLILLIKLVMQIIKDNWIKMSPKRKTISATTN